MTELHTTTVLAAFEQVLEEMEAEIDRTIKEGQGAFGRKDFSAVESMRQRAEQLTDLRNRVASIRTEWRTLIPPSSSDHRPTSTTAVERANLGRLQRGIRTPEESFAKPILQALVEFNGSGRMADVLTRVEQIMRTTLRQVDFEPLASQPDEPRWRNTAQWARNSMVKEGLLKSNSPWGVWEISDAGRKYLADGKS